MKTNQRNLREAPQRNASEALRSPPGEVARDGGRYDAGLIRGVSAITRGEALGHGFWVDDEFLGEVATALNASDRKARFRHPGVSSDGLGSALGVASGASVVDGKVLTDLHFLQSAHDTPEGNLAGYVMDFAAESPDLFGTSIVFRIDEEATKAHALAHGAEEIDGFLLYDNYASPDPDNRDDLPHVRLQALKAVDIVDEPAANPDGMFAALSSEGQMIEEFEACLEYALGLSDDCPDFQFLEIHPQRIKHFVSRFADARGMTIHFNHEKKRMFTAKKNEQVEPLTARIEELENEVESLTSERNAAREEAAALMEAQLSVKAAADQATNQDAPSPSLEASFAALAGELRSLREEVAALPALAEQRAQEKLAAAGHPAVDIPEGDSPGVVPSQFSELETYEGMEPGPEKVAFLATNKINIHTQAMERGNK